MDFFYSHQGEFAAIATAICWTLTTLSFEAGGRRVGSMPLNLIRLVFALVLLMIFCTFYRGAALPLEASSKAWLWLGLSGIIGFTIGDLFFFRALVVIGARLASLVMLTLAPPLAAILGWIWLGESLSLLNITGMGVTIIGVALVIMEKKPNADKHERKQKLLGIVLALLGAVGQSVAAVISKIGMEDIDPAGATEIRIIAGIVGFVVVFTVIGKWNRVINAFKDKIALLQISGGSVVGPFMGVMLFQSALVFTEAGIAQTIVAIVPVLVIPFAYMFFRQKTNFRAILGAVIAFAGVSMLFMD